MVDGGSKDTTVEMALQYTSHVLIAPRGRGGNGDAGKKVTKSYSIDCNPFSRAMVSPLSTENITPGAHL